MSYKEEIIDYNLHQEEIDKWIALKGEPKYMRFVKLLQQNNVEVKWVTLKDTYRYDKRLLINLFKYLSFFEEFLRALIWNTSKNSYKNLERASLLQIIDNVIRLQNSIDFKEFSIDELSTNKYYIIELRNRVSHNKIILESTKNGCDIKEMLTILKNILPQSYQKGFAEDINACASRLEIPKQLIVNI